MGGRVATLLAAEGLACDFNGTRDPLCRRDLMERALAGVRAPWTMHWLEGADHSFHVLKSSGRSDEDVLGEVGEAVSKWVRSYPF